MFGERSASLLQKARKDLLQAAALLDCLKFLRPGDVQDAWVDLLNRGRGWRAWAKQELEALESAAPDLEIRAWLSLKAQGLKTGTVR